LVSGGLPMINGDIGIGRLIPLPLLGEGTVRLLEILLAISTTRDGVVLIDEIENGLHYSVLKKVWKAIAQYARKSNSQIVTTTHSWESIEAAREKMGSTGIQILDFGGVADLKSYLGALKVNSGFIQLVKSIGIVRDAELDSKAAFASVCGSLQRVKLPVPRPCP
jgi:ABC-type multidrug transport system ATPase subunit